MLQTVDKLCEDPERYPIEEDNGYRRWRFVVFPYSLRYEINSDGNITIVAVAHGARRPGYFQGR